MQRVGIVMVLGATAIVGGYVYARPDGIAAHAVSRAADPTTRTTTTPSSTSSTSTTTPLRTSVALVGDSLSAQSVLNERVALDNAGWRTVTINAQPGRSVRAVQPASATVPSSGIAAVREIRASGSDPHTWIIELGTNDVSITRNDAGAIRGVIDQMLSEIGPGHRVVWVNIHRGDDLASSATFNHVLAQVAAERNDVVVADWAAQATTPGYLITDGIHLTLAGQAAFATVITTAAG
ncbi:MAG: hypothetical protein JWL83_1892 [Actinomycetia bacterium]|nr:hypothetical protein [Actinomycetes bacterium]